MALFGSRAFAARAQQPSKLPIIGALVIGNTDPGQFWREFRQGLRDLGYVEGQNIRFELRSAEGTQQATREIPIVMAETGPNAPRPTGPARVHHATWRCGGRLAASGACATACDAGDRISSPRRGRLIHAIRCRFSPRLERSRSLAPLLPVWQPETIAVISAWSIVGDCCPSAHQKSSAQSSE
jgi:hypothetical protein